jgi:hypothetical protein
MPLARPLAILARTGLALVLSLPLATGAKAGAMTEAYRAFYADLEARLVAQGRLRTDRGQAGTDAASLARDFVDIALYEEYAGGALSANKGHRAGKPLLRWEDPVRMQVLFGASVPEARRAEDRRAIHAYAGRLSSITGHPIAPAQDAANFHVLVVNEDERRSLRSQLPRLIPGISPWMVNTIGRMQKTHLCMVVAVPHADPSRGYARAVAILRAEHSGRLRQACLEEELAQAMGLPNDCDTTDPSIFTDNLEHASLTRRDELLLKMLYHPSLASGMTRDEAMPAITRLAETLATR